MTSARASETKSASLNGDSAHTSIDVRRATRDAVYRAILDVAPDLDEAGLEPTTHLHDELGLDSIDLVNIAKAIEERTGVVIPEADYARLHRISQLVDFVAERRTQKP